MKRIFILSMLAICSCYSCQKEEIAEQAHLQAPEYFSAKINGVDFLLTDPEEIGGSVYPGPGSKVRTFDFWGEREAKYYHEAIVFKIRFYKGPGTYYTGNNYNISYADYRDAWYNDYRLEDPAEVIIIKASETFIEGTFAFTAFNYKTSDFVNIEGSFGVALEENPSGY